MIFWHRLLGLILADFFRRSSYDVEVEIDLSEKQQRLDVIIIEKGKGKPIKRLPDGLDDLGPHNLMTYKSQHAPVDAWVIDELVGHYVNYRKLLGGDRRGMPPIEDFRLYAVSTRRPRKLARQVALDKIQDGVYETYWGTHRIRVLVLKEMPHKKHNAIWELFSGTAERVAQGAAEYDPRTPDMNSVINEICHSFGLEMPTMPYTMENFKRDIARKYLRGLTAKERVDGLSPEERLVGLSPGNLLEALSPKDVKALLREIRRRGFGEGK